MPIPSFFEKALLAFKEDDDSFDKRLLQYLDDSVSLRRLRSVSRVLHDAVGRHPGRLFRQLYVRAPLPEHADIRSLDLIAPMCFSLTIKVGFPARKHFSTRTIANDGSQRSSLKRMPSLLKRRRSTTPGDKERKSALSIRSLEGLSLVGSPHARPLTATSQLSSAERQQQTGERQLWTQLLSQFHQLRSLALRINGDPAWPGRTTVEDMLVTLRVALEAADLQELRDFSLMPVHAMGIIHIRWHGIRAFSQAQASGAHVWMRIETLDLRIHSPFAAGKLTDAQQIMFKKILYEYLRSFAPSLRCLRLVWLGREGPSPLAVNLEPGLEGRPVIRWPRLQELFVGNIKLPNQTTTFAREHATPDTRVRILRSTRRDSSVEASDSSAWVDVLGPGSPNVLSPLADRASSVYSQDDQKSDGSAWAGGISRSSQSVMCMLDVK